MAAYILLQPAVWWSTRVSWGLQGSYSFLQSPTGKRFSPYESGGQEFESRARQHLPKDSGRPVVALGNALGNMQQDFTCHKAVKARAPSVYRQE
jgi:hypothetical protein